jgi:predicted DCC family thiol-disulfide oxidoreductase YuxK
MSEKTKVYFDGDCYVCSLEMQHYSKNKGACDLQLVDISQKGFSAETEGLDPKRIHDAFHVRSADGRLIEGVDAFREIWKQLPGYGWAYKVSGFPPIHLMMRMGYGVFRRIRPYLPKKSKWSRA